LIPMIFVLITSAWAAVLKLIEWYQAGNWLLVTIDLVVLITSVLVILEAGSVISRYRNEKSTSDPV
jgi:carbon starvation protein